MSDLQSISEPSSRDHVHTNVGPEAPNAAVLSEAMEARARLCFRALSLFLAAAVLALVSVNLYVVTNAFVERTLPIAPPHAIPAELVADADEPTEAPRPESSSPHAIVAVISILLVGDVVLAIGLIRATFSTKLHAEGAPTTTRETASDSLGLPIFELLKAVVDAIATVLKGLPKR